MAVLATALVGALDAASGSRLVLIGGLVVGPVVASVSCRARDVARASEWALALAVILGIPDGIWATYQHALFVGVVAVVSVVGTVAAAVAKRSLASPPPR